MNIERNLLSLGLAATLLAATLLASCSQDDSRMGADAAGSGHSLSITSATIGNPVTRVTGDDVAVVLEKGSMGLFRAESAGYTAALNNLKYTYSADGWQPATTTDTLFLHGDDAKVCAYYPHNTDVTKYNTATAIPLQSGKYVGSATVVDLNDICYDIDRSLNAYQRSTTFALKHAMAMLEFSITKSLNYLGECKLTGITLRNPELIASSTIDITKKDTYNSTPTKAAVSYNPAAGAEGLIIDTATPTVSAALLVPFTPTAEGVTIVFSVNGTSVETVIENTDIAKFEPGHRYSVKVTMFPTELTVTSVALVPWVEVGVGGDDYVHYPVEETKKLTKPIHIGSYDWAWSNLDYVGGTPVLRDFQAWPDGYNMWWPYCTTTAISNYDGAVAGSVSYNYSTDPCSLLEPTGQWRYPTRHQAELLLGTDKVIVMGGSGGTEVLGYWFGTTEVIDPKKDDGKYLFLPMEYYITVNNIPAPPGVFWLSDIPGLALLVPGRTDELPAIGGYDTQRHNGSVRCVKGAVRTTIKLGGVEWAMGNLRIRDGAYVIDDHQAVIGNLIGSGEGTWTAAVNPGYHFNWNWPDRSITDENANHPYNADNDPCGKVAGGSWRTPTQAEFQAAIDAGSVRGEYRINGVTVRGTYLGTTTKPDLALGNGDDYLFLPDGGSGDMSSYYKWYNQYWTSTPDVSDNKNAYVFEGNNQMGGSTENPPLMKSIRKSFGCSVRCVKVQ